MWPWRQKWLTENSKKVSRDWIRQIDFETYFKKQRKEIKFCDTAYWELR